ncbi:DUF3300 domain-containing protein [Acuticoccus sp. MNP-M23]|uniref:DUF3300 domain-containing protein n=1 Tax=Acuticoccus sp. MNP-M23 TaxID=3072793 RepID=UPI0028160459|nr:DUF3300 domain-containing protein [Acuticoccus sp. MNP-M23]WMS43850.1 DUF3300 domain-containing protein [Acuticoccus sp. MNP-M23]
MKFTLALLLVPAIGIASAQADPGITTADVNFRAGPSTSDKSFGVLPNGTDVDIGTCDANGWCAITVGGEAGYASQNYLQSQAPLTTVAAPSGSGDGSGGSSASGSAPAYTADELDTLVAPVALYPDAVLAQVLVAVTVPLDVVKAQRWVAANKDMAADKRAAATKAEGWNESVATLAAGFPSVIDQLGNNLDNTQELGNAVIVQSDDVMAAIQRQREKAKDLGNLASNQAQTVTVNNNNEITIAPAKPDTIYVPTYNPATVYTTAAPAPVYVETGNTGYDAGAVLATGAISFAAGFAVSSVFDNNWNRNYWYGPPRINWNNGNFYPRPGYRPNVRNTNVRNTNVRVGNVNVGNTVNVGNRVGNNVANGAWRPTPQQRASARHNINTRNGVRDVPRRDRGAGPVQRQRPNAASMERSLERQRTGAPRRTTQARRAPAARAHHANVSRPARAKAPRRATPQRRSAFHQERHRRPAASARARGNRSMHRGGREFRGNRGGRRAGGFGHRGGGRR